MDIWNAFIANVDVWALYFILACILGNLFLGLILALKGGKLELVKLADFLKERVIPYCGGYLVVVVLAAIPGLAGADYAEWFRAMPLTAFAFIAASLTGKLKEQLQQLGLPIPNIPLLEAKKPIG